MLLLTVDARPLLTVASRPTMTELIIVGQDEAPLQVIQQIGSYSFNKCEKFAQQLLGDMRVIKKFRMQSKNNNKKFVPLVLNDWLERDDGDTTAVSRTWGALAQCVEQAGMDKELVKAIKDIDPRSELLYMYWQCYQAIRNMVQATLSSQCSNSYGMVLQPSQRCQPSRLHCVCHPINFDGFPVVRLYYGHA